MSKPRKPKHAKTRLSSLRQLFTERIGVATLAEELFCVDAGTDTRQAHAEMKRRGFDVAGVQENDSLLGYVDRKGAKDAPLKQQVVKLTAADWVEATLPVHEVMAILTRRDRLFVRLPGNAHGIVTRGDLQKAPVRMWLFALISLIEMEMARLIGEAHPKNTWRAALKADAIGLAQADKIHARQRRNRTDLDLVACLPLSSKAEVMCWDRALWGATGLKTEDDARDFFEDLSHCRNELFHAGDIVTGHWPKLATLAQRAEMVLEALEKVTLSPAEGAIAPYPGLTPPRSPSRGT